MLQADAKQIQWRNPWPSPQVAWPDPPWQLTGRVATAWFTVPWAVVEKVMSPDLLPEHAPTSRARLRFYDIAFTSLARPSSPPLVPMKGRFREAVVAFLARAGGIAGEVSLFMWTDSDPYMMWSREVFGFPLLRGAIDLSGTLWESGTVEGAAGTARLSAGDISATLVIEQVEQGTRGSKTAPNWITPRRILQRAGLSDETREVLIVRPEVRDPGMRHRATGKAALAFEAAHPLHGLEARDAECDVVDGFELIVGSDVDIL